MSYSNSGVGVAVNGQVLVVDLTTAGGTRPTVYSDTALTAAVTLPATIAVDTALYWIPDNNTYTLSVKSDGVEKAGQTIIANGNFEWVAPGPNVFPYGRGDFRPSDHGLLGWTFSPAEATSGVILPTAGLVEVATVNLPRASTVTNIVMDVSTAGATLTAGQCFAALYQAGTLVAAGAITADQATPWASTGVKTMALTTAQALKQGQYQVAFWASGTTLPTFAARSAVNAATANLGLAAASSRFATGPGSTTTTAPATLGTLTPIATGWFVGLS